MLRDCLEDVRFGLRQFARTPVLTAIALVTLALGVGANTAVFSLLDSYLLQDLPVKNPQQLRTVAVVSHTSLMTNVPFELFEQLRPSKSFSGVFAFSSMQMNMASGDKTDRVLVQMVTGDYYSTLAVRARIGRTIQESDVTRHEQVAVISHPFWVRHFGADPAAIGKTLNLNGIPTVVIGVTAPDFFGTDRGVCPDITIPLEERRLANIWTTVRLRPGVDEKQALAEIELALQRALMEIRPRLERYRESDREEILTMHAALLPGSRGMGYAKRSYLPSLQILIVLCGMVLLIACGNIANLLLARSISRSTEMGVRIALGAGGLRLVRQMLTESALLAVTGTAMGIGCAFWMHRGLVLLLMNEFALEALPFTLNSHLLAFAAGMAILTALLFGIIPALRASQTDAWSLLKSDAHSPNGFRLGFAKGLIIIQVGVAMLLLVSSGLLVRTFRNLSAVDPGLEVRNMVMMTVSFNPKEHSAASVPEFYQQLASRVAEVPGVKSVALGADFAFSYGGWNKAVWVEGQPAERDQTTNFNVVGPAFFSTSGIPLISGREFTTYDRRGKERVVIVNETFAKRYFRGRNPIGMHLGDEGATSTYKYEVIGVVADSRNRSLRLPPEPKLYQSLLQDDFVSGVVLHIRTDGNNSLVGDLVRNEIRTVYRNVPVYDVSTLGAQIELALRQERMMAMISGFFGVLAVFLTSIGVYGVIAYAVVRRTREIGIRIALGASPGKVRQMILRETLGLVIGGAVVGIPAAIAGGAALKAALFGVAPQDPATIAVCFLVLLVAGCIAAYVPAHQASELDPMEALRAE
ncbi:MAG: ABC transporter permease [Acidobacteriaceae bacterium]